jgi:hypothetical protein
MAKQSGNEVAPLAVDTLARPDDDELRGIESFEDAVAALQATGVDIVSAEELLGTGFRRVLSDEAAKAELCERPFLLYHWFFSPGSYIKADGGYGQFVTMFIITEPRTTGEEPLRLIVTDGSTGIAEELWNFTKKYSRNRGLYLKDGFRASTYEIGSVDPTDSSVPMPADKGGVKRPVRKGFPAPTEPATTFYLNV